MKPERFREQITAKADALRRNLKITTLNLNLPRLTLGAGQPDLPKLTALLESYEMRTTVEDARKRYGQRELF